MAEVAIGSIVELMGVENAGIDISGKRGTVTAIPGHGLVSVQLDSNDVTSTATIVSAWPENIKVLSSAQVAQEFVTTGIRTMLNAHASDETAPVAGSKRTRPTATTVSAMSL